MDAKILPRGGPAANRPHLRAAIDSMCRACIHDPAAPGTWREQVAQCSVLDCALWPVRPAPTSGAFANPPRDRATVTPEWLKAPVGMAVMADPTRVSAAPDHRAGVTP